jgi:DNA-binding MarR family transcriptional regulator
VVDRIIEEWQRERPDLDASGKAVTARIVWLGDAFHRAFDAEYARFGLKRSAYSALLALRRSGPPFELAPSQITEQLFVTSGGLTPLLDRLERDDLVRRRPHPVDRRGVIVSLTDAGRELVDQVMAVHVETEQRLLSGISAREREQLATLLKKLLQHAGS